MIGMPFESTYQDCVVNQERGTRVLARGFNGKDLHRPAILPAAARRRGSYGSVAPYARLIVCAARDLAPLLVQGFTFLA